MFSNIDVYYFKEPLAQHPDVVLDGFSSGDVWTAYGVSIVITLVFTLAIVAPLLAGSTSCMFEHQREVEITALTIEGSNVR